MNFSKRRFWRPRIPALAVVLPAGLLWLWTRFIYARGAGGGAEGGLRVNAFVGWIGFLFLLNTIAAAIGGGCLRGGNGAAEGKAKSAGREWLSGVLLIAASAALLTTVAMGGGFFGWAECGRLCLLLAGWTALWYALARALSRWGVGVGIGLTFTLSMLLLSGPITLVPLARAAGAASSWQGRIAQAIATGCPLLGAVDAVRPAVRIDWAQLPRMYALSGLGQDIPLALPPWWVNALAYALPAAMIGLYLRIARPMT